MSANRFKIGDLVQWGDSNTHVGIVAGVGNATTHIESWCAVRWLNSRSHSFDKAIHYHINNLEPYKDVSRAN